LSSILAISMQDPNISLSVSTTYPPQNPGRTSLHPHLHLPFNQIVAVMQIGKSSIDLYPSNKTSNPRSSSTYILSSTKSHTSSDLNNGSTDPHNTTHIYGDQNYSLSGVGSQFWTNQSFTSQHNQYTPTSPSSQEPKAYCPYHNPILTLQPSIAPYERPPPIGRYLTEGPSDQYALIHHEYPGELLIDKGCTCNASPIVGYGGAGYVNQ